MPPNVVVTGGSGFLGSAIIRMISTHHPDWIIYNFDLKTNRPDDRGNFVFCDVLKKNNVDAAFARIKPTIIVHTAGVVPKGQSRYSRSKGVRDWTFGINVGGTRNVLQAARQNGCQSFVYTSSCTIMADDVDHDYHYMDETMPTGQATLAYGASKTIAEAAVLAASSAEMATCALRPCTIIGAGDNYGVIGAIHACIANGETPFIIGDGDNMYDLVHVDNVALAHLLAVENLTTTKTAAGEAFFISNQEPIYFRDFMLAIWARFVHKPPYQIHIPARLAKFAGYLAEWMSYLGGRESALSRGSVKDAIGIRYSNNDKAVKILGYKPIVSFSDAVKLACDDYKQVLQKRALSNTAKTT